MKNKSSKRILSILLAMVMLVGLLPTAAIPAFAAELIGRNTISSVAITVDRPIAGEPLANCVPETTLCDITCTWSVRGLKGVTEVPATTIAKAGTIYYLAMILTPKVDLYTFAASVTGTVNGNTVTVERMSSTRVACMVPINPVRPAGSGTEADPFRIGTVGELYWFEGFVNGDITDDDFTVEPSAACAQLTSNITVNDNLLVEDGQPSISDPKEWTPIGLSTAYTGTFDGQDYTISGIYYDPQTGSTSNEEDFGGFFGTIGAGGSVCNLTLEDSFLRSRVGVAYAYTGGITGVLELNGTVENCHFDGTVTTGDSSDYDGMGGIAAVNRGVIQNCTTKGMVYGFASNVGGIAGYVYRKNGEGGEVNGCVNEATVGTTMKADDSPQFSSGGIVGSSMFGIIKDCCNKGDLPSAMYVGGIAGRIEGSNAAIIRCWNEGRIEWGYGAGIVSYLGNYAAIENCYNAGQVSQAGIVALYQQGFNTISNCHNVGEVLGNNPISAFTSSSTVKIKNCYYLSDSESESSSFDGTTYKTAAEFAGGLVMFLLNAGDNAGNWKQGGAYPILNTVFTLTVNGGTGSGTYGVGTEVTITATVPDGMVFAGWDGIDGLIVEAGQPAEDSVSTTFLMPKRDVALTAKFVSAVPARPARGDGTEGNPFQITNIGELYWFAGFVNKTVTAPDLTVEPKVACAELMNDITVNYCLLTEDGALNDTPGFVEWIPIGLTAGYDGTFDGNGKIVNGIYCAPQDATKTYYGFFSHIDEGCVRNLTLVDSYFCAPAKNTAYTGGIAGQVYENGTVENCHFDGTVTTAITGDSENKEYYTHLEIAGIAGYVLGEVRDCTVRGLISGYGRLVGGIAAYVHYGEVSGCVNEATVENTRSDTEYYYTGGIAATIRQGTVRDCCNKSNVSSGWISAGIVCHVEDKGSTVSRCWNEGEIKNGSGIVCLLKGTVQNCYNTGKVECGIVGQPNSGSSITYCHNVGEIPSYGSPIWGVSSSDVEIADCYYMADSETDEYDGTTYKTAAEFADGTVLALLDNGNWEQGDDYPVLAAPKGVTVSGTVTGSNSDTDEVTVQLIPDGTSEVAYETVVKGNATSYSLSGVADGRYTLKVQAEGGRVRCYEITVAGESVCQDVSVVEYTVTFQNWNGSVITTATYFDGETVEVPADPVRQKDNTYTYTFSGWDKEVVACAGHATYRATYTSEYIDYTVIFMDADGKQLSKATYHYGDTVVVPNAPTKEADSTYTYTFSGWDQEVVPCTKDAVYTAVFTAHVRGVRVSGTVTSFGSDTDNITIELYAEGSASADYTVTAKGNTAVHSIEGVAEGVYTLKVSKKNHVTREYTVTIDGASVTQDVKICLTGDATGDGKINMADVAKVFAHVRNKTKITDTYMLACANATGDTKVNMADVARIFAHVRGKNPLF